MSKKRRVRLEAARAEITARRREAQAVSAGIDETLGLERARGAAFAAEDDAAERTQPYRRQPGLDWLARKGRINEDQKAAGLRYRDAYAIAAPTISIGSTLEVQPGGSAGGPSLKAIVARAGLRAQAEAKLALYRARLSQHPTLVAACDLVCGRELTPREAAGAEREALKLEAVLVVALDLLAGV